MGRRGSLLTAILATLVITSSLVVAGSTSHAPTLGQAAAAGRPNVLVIETDPQSGTASGGAWWNVPVAEVSGDARVRAARDAWSHALDEGKD